MKRTKDKLNQLIECDYCGYLHKPEDITFVPQYYPNGPHDLDIEERALCIKCIDKMERDMK